MTEPKAVPQHLVPPPHMGLHKTEMEPASAAPMPVEPTPLKLWRSREPIGPIWREIADYADTLRARCEELRRELGARKNEWDFVVAQGNEWRERADKYAREFALKGHRLGEAEERAEQAERDRATLAAAVKDADNCRLGSDVMLWREHHAEALRIAGKVRE